MNILHIDSGISHSQSVSRLLTGEIVARLIGRNPSATVVYRDLVECPIPYMNVKTMPSSHPVAVAFDELSQEERLDRNVTEAVLSEFLVADVIVLGLPMYNFGVAAQLKSWFDMILIPGKTFAYSSSGPRGLAADKRIILAVTRGGFYSTTDSSGRLEHAESYVRAALSVIGVVTPELVIAEGIALDRTEAIERGRTAIESLESLSETG